MYQIRRKKSDYNSKNASHAFVAGFVLAILVKKTYVLSMDPFMLKKVFSQKIEIFFLQFRLL